MSAELSLSQKSRTENGPVPSKRGMTSSQNPIDPGSQSAEPGDPNGKFFLGKRDIIREMPRFLQESALISYNREGRGGAKQLIQSRQLRLVDEKQPASQDATLREGSRLGGGGNVGKSRDSSSLNNHLSRLALMFSEEPMAGSRHEDRAWSCVIGPLLRDDWK